MINKEEYLKAAIEREIEELADDHSHLFEDGDIKDAEKYIKDLIEFASANGIDFWAHVKANCSKFEYERLESTSKGIEDEPVHPNDDKLEVDRRAQFEARYDRDGKIYISRKEAKKVFEKYGQVDTRFYYIGKSVAGMLFCSKQQMEFMKDKGYDAYPALVVDELEKYPIKL